MARRFLMMTDLSKDELERVLADAATLKLDRLQRHDAMAGKSVGIFFEHPSTRTRISSEVAISELGAHAVALRGDEVGLGTREAPEDVAAVLSRYLAAVAMRVKSHTNLEVIAESATIPVINLLSDRSHPCQGLADLQTIAEHRPLAGARLAYFGDGNNVAHSLLLGAAMTGMHMVVAAPSGFEPAGDIVSAAEEIAAGTGGSVTITGDPEAAAAGSHVIYTDVWTSMGQEGDAAGRMEQFAPYQVNEELFAAAEPDAIFLHCLPAHRGEEVSAGMLAHVRSFVFDQAENRLHAFKALLAFLHDNPE